MDQVQGSTELMSQPAMTPFSSRIRLFTAISAATATPQTQRRRQNQNQKSPNPNLDPEQPGLRPTRAAANPPS
jgi:hypothetical protein